MQKLTSAILISGYTAQLAYGLFGGLELIKSCDSLVPQLSRFYSHFSADDICSANSILVTSLAFFSAFFAISLFLAAIVWILTRGSSAEVSAVQIPNKKAFVSATLAIMLLCLGLWFVRGIELDTPRFVGAIRPVEDYASAVDYALGQSRVLHVFVGAWGFFLLVLLFAPKKN